MADANSSSWLVNEATNDTLRMKYHRLHLSYLLKAIEWAPWPVHLINWSRYWLVIIDMTLAYINAGMELTWEDIMYGRFWITSSGILVILIGLGSLMLTSKTDWKDTSKTLVYGSKTFFRRKLTFPPLRLLYCTPISDVPWS